MSLRLRPNEPLSRLTEQLSEVGGPLAVRELDLTNCIDVDPKQLFPVIAECTALQRLRCAASAILPSDVIEFAMQQTSHLVEIELSCLVDSNLMEAEIERIILSAYRRRYCTLHLRRIYCEVRQDHNIELLSALLHISPKAENLHVHLVCGDFQKTVQQCRLLLAMHKQLDKFTFTSEVPPPIQVEPAPPFDFAACAAICANVSHQMSIDYISCARLRDLVNNSEERVRIPLQAVLVAVEHGLTPEWIHLASVKHDWNYVRHLCLLLLPPRPTSFYPAAGGQYRHCLSSLSTQLKHVVEVNISTFHFEPSLDVTALLQDGSLKFLQSLAAPPCGFRRVSALRHLALHCPDFKELDVRFERKGSFTQCDGCEGIGLLVTDGGTEFRDGAGPVFRNGLVRLTLSEVHDNACLWFIECCRPMTTLRLSYCPSKEDIDLLCRVLAESGGPSCLILRHLISLDDTALLANLHCFAKTRYLYLLTEETPLSLGAASNAVTAASQALPQLKCLHAHYPSIVEPNIDEAITWMRGPRGEKGDRLFRGGPCFQNCSTATFIGLAKPLNRDIEPML